MMRRMFWLGLGAVLGVSGYRKATQIARSLRPAPRQSALAGFAADVREGMAVYRERQAQQPPPTHEAPQRGGLPSAKPPRPSAPHHDEQKDGP